MRAIFFCKLFENIKINLENGNIRQIRILGFPILERNKNSNPRYSIPFSFYKKKFNKNKPMFYLKVNRNSQYLIPCVQHWINIIHEIGGDFIFVCDRYEIKRKILKGVKFYDKNITFIKSNKSCKLKKMIKKLSTGHWKKATYANLTVFHHAKTHNITNFWNIDADDTTIILDPKECAKTLNKVMTLAKKNDIKTISLDMWRSRTQSKHWSWGVAYINNFNNFFDIVKKLPNNSWMQHYKDVDCNFNLDWFFTYLKDFKNYKIESFYIDKCYFIHWGDFLINYISASISFWNKEYLEFPILLDIFKNENLGKINISSDCIKIELDEGVYSDLKTFGSKYLDIKKKLPKEIQKLTNLENEIQS